MNEVEKSKVYVKLDERSRIICCDGGYTTPKDLSGWTQIDEGTGDKYNLCQSHYFDGELYTADGIPHYKLVDGKAIERTVEEIEADRAALHKPVDTTAQLKAAVSVARMVVANSIKNDSATANDVIAAAPLFDEWVRGSYKVNDVRNHGGQPWKCRQDHDNAVYPDIEPGTVAGAVFWINFHATSKELALPWVAPTGAHDVYKTGEYMVYTDGKTYECLSDTNFSPEDFPQAWKVVDI